MALDAEMLLASLDEMELSIGIAKETIIEALKEALVKGYKKQLGGDDAIVSAYASVDDGDIHLIRSKEIVEDVQDDFLEISLEEAQEANPHGDYKLGDNFDEVVTLDQLNKPTVNMVLSLFRQKLAEVEKGILYNQYKDKIGTTVVANVEKVEQNGITVNLGKTSLYVPRKELIGDERFSYNEPIKFYVADVVSNVKGTKIIISRAHEGYLKSVLEENIHEIYDGTIVIKSIARRAGERSKIAVYSDDENVDPAGACIGPNGNRIQQVCSNLGNSSNKEKIDIIGWSESDGLYIAEALKPAPVIGIQLDKDARSAVAIVSDGSLSVAIGKRGINVILASKLTGYHIDIKEYSTAVEEGIEYQTIEELQAEEISRKQEKVARALRERDEALAAMNAMNKEMLANAEEHEAKIEAAKNEAKEAKEAAKRKRLERKAKEEAAKPVYVAPGDRHYEDEISEEEKDLLLSTIEEEELENSLNEPLDDEDNDIIEEEEVLEEEVKAEPVKEEKPEVIEKVDVKTTKSLEDLEAELMEEANKNKQAGQKKRSYHKNNKDEKEESLKELVPNYGEGEKMSIYTEEELQQFAEEDSQNDNFDDDVDYDEYEDYYDDDEQ